MSEQCDPNCLFFGSDHIVTKDSVSGEAASSLLRARMARRLYTSIKAWQMRILSLHPGHSVPPKASLRIASIVEGDGVILYDNDERINFDAVTYSWGKPVFECRLLLDQGEMPITRSLYEALLRFRHLDRSRHLWVDQICINQLDKDDKSSQLPKMRSIYRKAQHVLAWLGGHSAGSKNVLEYLKRLGNLIETNHGPNFSISNTEFEALAIASGFHLCKSHITRMVDVLLDFATRSWFSRIWVKQEVWFAQVLHVFCGDIVLSWKHLWLAIPLIELLSHNTEDQAVCFIYRSAAQRLKSLEQGLPNAPGRTIDVVEILNLSTHADSSDPRDRIYGILGMTNVRTSTDRSTDLDRCLMIDYAKSTAEVYQDLTVYLLRTRGYTLLTWNAKFGGSVDQFSIPSWVIDWRQPCMSSLWTQLATNIQHVKAQQTEATASSTEGGMALIGHCIGSLALNDQPGKILTSNSGNASLVEDSSVRTLAEMLPSKEGLRRRWMKVKRVVHMMGAGAGEPGVTMNDYFPEGDRASYTGDLYRQVDERRPLGLGSARIPGTIRALVRMYQEAGLPDFGQQDDLFYRLNLNERLEYVGRYLPEQQVFIKDKTAYSSFWVVPVSAKTGDTVIMCDDNSLPIIVRQEGQEANHFSYIGPCMIEKWPDAPIQREVEMFLAMQAWLLAGRTQNTKKVFHLL